MGVFIVTFYKRIGDPCQNEDLWRKRLRLCEKDSDFVFICGMNVCSYIEHVKIMHIWYNKYI